jgi:Ala-tRNA(Pro) deacylase
MAIAPTVQRYLTAKKAVYDLVQHEPTKRSMHSAETCAVSGDRVAKAVVLRDADGYLMAVLPASHHIRMKDLRKLLGANVDLATEHEIEDLFRDCARGAIPPMGECYGLDTVIDDSIDAQPEVYLEAGDHATLIRMGQVQFASLTATALHGSFSEQARAG